MQLAPSNTKATDRSGTDMEARLASLQSGMDTLKAENHALKQELGTTFEQIPKGVFVMKMFNNPGQ